MYYLHTTDGNDNGTTNPTKTTMEQKRLETNSRAAKTTKVVTFIEEEDRSRIQGESVENKAVRDRDEEMVIKFTTDNQEDEEMSGLSRSVGETWDVRSTRDMGRPITDGQKKRRETGWMMILRIWNTVEILTNTNHQ